jgi:hypothetical protein
MLRPISFVLLEYITNVLRTTLQRRNNVITPKDTKDYSGLRICYERITNVLLTNNIRNTF